MPLPARLAAGSWARHAAPLFRREAYMLQQQPKWWHPHGSRQRAAVTWLPTSRQHEQRAPVYQMRLGQLNWGGSKAKSAAQDSGEALPARMDAAITIHAPWPAKISTPAQSVALLNASSRLSRLPCGCSCLCLPLCRPLPCRCCHLLLHCCRLLFRCCCCCCCRLCCFHIFCILSGFCALF